MILSSLNFYPSDPRLMLRSKGIIEKLYHAILRNFYSNEARLFTLELIDVKMLLYYTKSTAILTVDPFCRACTYILSDSYFDPSPKHLGTIHTYIKIR